VDAGHGRPEGTLLGFFRYFPLACSDAAFECGDQTAVPQLFGCTADSESRVSEASAYKSRPSGRLGVEAVNFSRNARLRSLFATLCFRSRWKRALSPLIADMVSQA
jgi:hypothetical protein